MTHTEYMRIWRAKNIERWREITRKAGAKWRKANKDKIREKGRKERDLIRFGGLREVVLKRDNYSCVICTSSQNLSVDHIDGDRTNNTEENLQTLCLRCHGHKDGLRGWLWTKSGKAKRNYVSRRKH